jgi:hypothetical protein
MATSSFAASRPCSWNFAFDRNIGSGPAQARRLIPRTNTTPRRHINYNTNNYFQSFSSPFPTRDGMEGSDLTCARTTRAF